MATETLTETEQINDCSLNITLSVAQTDHVLENKNGIQNTEKDELPKANDKNSNLKESKQELAKRTSFSKDKKHAIDKQFSTPELDGDLDSDTDSADDNYVQFANEFESLELSEEEAQKSPPVQGCNDSLCQSSSSCAPTFFEVPNVPMPTARKKCNKNDNTLNKNKGKGARVQPTPTVVRCLAAFQHDQEDIDTPRDTEFDVNESYKSDAATNSPISGCMIDFIIIHSKDDSQAALVFQQHLRNDTRICNLTVETFSDIGFGETDFQKAAKLHDKCRCILVYVTYNFTYDRYVKFERDIALRKDLKMKNEEDGNRVVPVFTPGCQVEDDILSVITGLRYFNFYSKNSIEKENYLGSVRNLCNK